MTWKVVFTKESAKDKKKLEQNPLMLKKVKALLCLMQENPFELPYEKLLGNFSGCYSRRINVQHRFTGIEDSEIVEFSTHHMEDDSYRETQSGKVPDDEFNRILQEEWEEYVNINSFKHMNIL